MGGVAHEMYIGELFPVVYIQNKQWTSTVSD